MDMDHEREIFRARRKEVIPKYTIRPAKLNERITRKKLPGSPSNWRRVRIAEGIAQMASTRKTKPMISFQSTSSGRITPGRTCFKNLRNIGRSADILILTNGLRTSFRLSRE